MARATRAPALNLVGANGQISLGKPYAGRQVLVEERQPGVWIVRSATVIPEKELWLHESKASADLDATMAWLITHAPDDADLVNTLNRLGHATR